VAAVNDNVFQGNTLTGNAVGLGIFGERNTVSGNNLSNSTSKALSINGSDFTIGPDNIITNAPIGIYSLASSPVTIFGNTISGNTSFGVQNADNGTVIDAPNNDWGDPSGPLDNDVAVGGLNDALGLSNPGGLGDAVTDFVDYWPYVGAVLDTEGPVASLAQADPNPVQVGGGMVVSSTIDDRTTGGSTIASAEYRVDDGPWMAMTATDGFFDAVTEPVEATLYAPTTPAVSMLCVRGTDAVSNLGAEECVPLVTYDPSGGFVSGGGWLWSPAGAYTPDPSAVGKAHFGFQAKYEKGAQKPDGNTHFLFKTADLEFSSESYDWLVVNQAGANAQFKGYGTINGMGDYRFILWAGDGDPDTFRIKIWEEVGGTETVIYDNGFDQPIEHGNVIVHKEKKN